MQQGDVLLFQTNDSGDINVENGIVEMTGGFETQAYLSLFGGNILDDGTPNNPFTWWGNVDEPNPAFRYVSETQHLLQNLPAVTGNLVTVEDAAKNDLQMFINTGAASTVTVVASLPAINRLQLDIVIEAQGVESSFTFVENWKSMVN